MLLKFTSHCSFPSYLYRFSSSVTFPRLYGFCDSANSNYQRSLVYSESLLEKYNEYLEKKRAGGGIRGVERHTKVHRKLLVADRLRLLLDAYSHITDSDVVLHLSSFGGIMPGNDEYPGGGGIAVIARVAGTRSLVVANDATVKGGSVYPIGLHAQLRLFRLAMQLELPLIYIVDSAGAYLPLQDQIFSLGGKMFYNEALSNAANITQLAIVCGSCTAGGAYLPMMTPNVVHVERIGHVFLGGPPLVQAATGEVMTADEIGGARLHCETSGCSDYYAATEEEAFATARQVFGALHQNTQPFDIHNSIDKSSSSNRKQIPNLLTSFASSIQVGLPNQSPINSLSSPPLEYEEPFYPPDELDGLLPNLHNPNNAIIYQILARLFDGSRFSEFKKLYGKGLIVGFAKIHGWPLGVIASTGEWVNDGAAEKAAHFVQQCSERCIPLLFLQHTPDVYAHTRLYEDRYATATDANSTNTAANAAHTPGSKQALERDALLDANALRAQAKLTSIVATASVPKITLVIGNSYPPLSYALCGRAMDPVFLFSWPNARYAPMDDILLVENLKKQYAETLTKSSSPESPQALERSEDTQSEEELIQEVRDSCNAFYATARCFDDGILLPRHTRVKLSRCLAIIYESKGFARLRARAQLKDHEGSFTSRGSRWPVIRM